MFETTTWNAVPDDHGALTFGPFHLDPVRRELKKRRKPIRLEGVAFDLLLYLAEQDVKEPGKKHKIGDLMKVPWSDDPEKSMIRTRNALEQHFRKIYQALGEDRRHPAYTEFCLAWKEGDEHGA